MIEVKTMEVDIFTSVLLRVRALSEPLLFEFRVLFFAPFCKLSPTLSTLAMRVWKSPLLKLFIVFVFLTH
jgi:hypothetical protein